MSGFEPAGHVMSVSDHLYRPRSLCFAVSSSLVRVRVRVRFRVRVRVRLRVGVRVGVRVVACSGVQLRRA